MPLIKRALACEDIGCFALTELTHGTNAQMIQTTATYDPKSKCFWINSMSERAMKFWIGGASQFANMTLLWANLIVDGKNYGPHGFAIQIRDNSNMRVLPGVIIGDCGAKYGYDGVGILFIILKKNRQWLDYFPEFQSPKRDPSQQDHGCQ